MVCRWVVSVAIIVAVSACGGGFSTCSEYAAAIEQKLAEAKTADEVFAWLEETSADAAGLIQRSGAESEACAGAVLDAMFTAGALELEAELDTLFNE